jgi:hypothetical protein
MADLREVFQAAKRAADALEKLAAAADRTAKLREWEMLSGTGRAARARELARLLWPDSR